MSANYLLNKLYFEKASSFEVVNLQKPQKALTDKEFCDLSYAGSQREIHFTFKFNQPVVVQVNVILQSRGWRFRCARLRLGHSVYLRLKATC